LLNEADDIDKITVRHIAERAGVGTGLINYHFKSKDNLLSVAMGDIMARTISKFAKNSAYSHMEPDVKLRAMMKELCDIVGNDEKTARFLLLREITEGNMQAPLFLIPLLKEIFGEQKDDMQLRIIALQIIQPIQISGLNTAAFHMYSGIELLDIEQRNRFIDTLIDNLIISSGKRG